MRSARVTLVALLALMAGLVLSCRTKQPTPPPILHPPAAPSGLFLVDRTATTVTLHWQDNADNEDGFRMYVRRDSTGAWVLRKQVFRSSEQTTVDSLTPGTPYTFHVTAYNEDGESSPSNDIAAATSNPGFPNAPGDVRGLALEENVVQVTWLNRGDAPTFIVQRRDTAAAALWDTLGTTPLTVTTYYDSTVHASSAYYYRVGASATAGTAWSDPSPLVETPAPGAPHAPDSLRVSVQVGYSVTLTWVDRSANETGFQIDRAPSGHGFVRRDSVGANVTTYVDSIGDVPDIYYYRVRAVNSYGVSTWTMVDTADYRYCSNGIIPLCRGNRWLYNVDSLSAGHWIHYGIQRRVIAYTYVNDTDYYLIGGWSPVNPQDSLYYLRNIDGEGVSHVDYPLGSNPSPALLFRYPPPPTGTWYTVHGDSVMSFGPGFSTIQIGDSVYSVIKYDYMPANGTYKTRVWIVPNTIGIVREIDFSRVHTADTLTVRNIYDYDVLNSRP